MIGIVVVSHSRALAEAAVELAGQMVPAADRPPLAVAASTPDGGFGTDATAVARAIAEVDSPDGVLVIVDLGSALLSTDLALELVDAETSDRTLVSPAGFLEGLLAAMVTASTGADLETVATDAADALSAKKAHLSDATGGPITPSALPPSPSSGGSTATAGQPHLAVQRPEAAGPATTPTQPIELVLIVPNEHGLHARPAAKFARIAGRHKAGIEVANLSRDGKPLNGASVAALTRLDARQGDRLAITVRGPQASELVRALLAFAADNFGDPRPEREAAPTQDPVVHALPQTSATTEPPGGQSRPSGRWRGVAVQGRLTRLDLDEGVPRPAGSPCSSPPASDVEAQLAGLTAALEVAGTQLRDLVERARREIGDEAAEMVGIQLEFLRDPAVLTQVRARIEAGDPAAVAWSGSMRTMCSQLEALDDNPYLQARGQDVTSLERRVRLLLKGRDLVDPSELGGVILVEELDAPTAVQLPATRLDGVITRGGGQQGHGVLIARQRGIPIVVDAGEALDKAVDGSLVSWPPRVVLLPK